MVKTMSKEKDGLKNNTVRIIDKSDERFKKLIAWTDVNTEKKDYKIEIHHHILDHIFFTRTIRDISIWKNIVVITWEP